MHFFLFSIEKRSSPFSPFFFNLLAICSKIFTVPDEIRNQTASYLMYGLPNNVKHSLSRGAVDA